MSAVVVNDDNKGTAASDNDGQDISVVELTKESPPVMIVDDDEANDIYHPLDEINDETLLRTIDGCRMELKHLQMENIIFVNFLQRNDPTLLDGMDKILKLAASHLQMQQQQDHHHQQTTLKPQISPDNNISNNNNSRIQSTTHSQLSFLSDNKTARYINLTEKNELVLRELEDTQTALEQFHTKSYRLRSNLHAELEEITLRLAETQEATEIFERTILIDAVDRLTQKIPAEKIARYLNEWLKSAQQTIDKTRMRTSTQRLEYGKLSVLLHEKEMLGERIQRVDFEQLEIENKHISERIEERTGLLLDMKRSNGAANLALSIQNKELLKQLDEIANVKRQIGERERKIAMLDDESEGTMGEVEEARIKCDRIKNMIDIYEVPDIMDYMKAKIELNTLRKGVKMWSRRKTLKDMALDSCIKEMKLLTGSKHVQSTWFLKQPEEENDGSINEGIDEQ